MPLHADKPSTGDRARRLYGFTEREWDDLVEATRELLAEVARDRGTITYGELVSRVAPGRLTPRSSGVVRLLGAVCAVEDAERGIMLGSLVVRTADGLPGEGYYRHAAELGRDVSDHESFWSAEVERVWDSYAG